MNFKTVTLVLAIATLSAAVSTANAVGLGDDGSVGRERAGPERSGPEKSGREKSGPEKSVGQEKPSAAETSRGDEKPTPKEPNVIEKEIPERSIGNEIGEALKNIELYNGKGGMWEQLMKEDPYKFSRKAQRVEARQLPDVKEAKESRHGP